MRIVKKIVIISRKTHATLDGGSGLEADCGFSAGASVDNVATKSRSRCIRVER